MQTYKAIYFHDYKKINPKAKGCILAFGKKNLELYTKIAPISSHNVRELLGTHSYVQLLKQASKNELSVNTFCLKLLEQSLSRSTLSKNKNTEILDPQFVTFRGGKKNPLHDWYSFLEGYSPEFVEYILDKYARRVNSIYDPFAGTGVTPLVAAHRGINAYYSEINPLLQFLIKTKVEVLSLDQKNRNQLTQSLKNINRELEVSIDNSKSDKELADNYNQIFSCSTYFEPKTFKTILKIRTYIDELIVIEPLVGNIVQVGFLNALVPSSLLQRAGDLRYKNEKELKKKTNLLEKAKENIEKIISDIEITEPIPIKPILLTEDAKLLDRLPRNEIDAVITSPPYLNGTNYFRNTKIELWFLKSIKTQNDLSGFRHAAITSGINDVSKQKHEGSILKEVKSIVNKLKQRAYDKRIPKMVADYFSDMSLVFTGLKKHLSDEAVIAIDIGDSIYGGIKVPTDTLLIKLLKNIGYSFIEERQLRKRISRNGKTVRQVLLIFKYKKYRQKKIAKKRNWQKKWNTFKATLPHKELPYSKRNWGNPLHSLCSYQGKMKPSLAYFLINTFTREGDTILDPFAGVGTIPFEGALNGRKTYGFEISPAALTISKAKLGTTNKKECSDTISKLENYIKRSKINASTLKAAKTFGFNKNLSEYFEAQTLNEIILAREYFIKNKPCTPSESLVVASLLHILHGNRPYALSRRSHGITPFAPTGNYEYRPLIPRLIKKVEKSLSATLSDKFVEGEMLFQDATEWWPRNIDNLDAIITSPPFFDSTRFYLGNWLRLWFSGWEPKEFKEKPLGFIDERQKTGFDVYEPVLRQARERIKRDGVLVMHLGKSNKSDMAKKISEIAKPWFKIADIFEESVEDLEKHGIRDKGTVTKHQYLILN